MNQEPVGIIGAINVALSATMAVLIGAEVVSPELGALLLAAVTAWMAVAIWIVRSRVASPLTQENLAAELAKAKAADGE
jgi:hypothetical protein